MSVQNGTNVLITIGGTTVNGTVSHSMDLPVDMIETTTKDSGGSKTYIAGEEDGTVTVECKYDDAATYGYSQAFAARNAKTSVTVIYGLQTTGKKAYQFDALISNVPHDAPQNDSATWTMELQKTGSVTEVTIS